MEFDKLNVMIVKIGCLLGVKWKHKGVFFKQVAGWLKAHVKQFFKFPPLLLIQKAKKLFQGFKLIPHQTILLFQFYHTRLIYFKQPVNKKLLK